MEKEHEDFIVSRCEKAMNESIEYQSLDKENCDREEELDIVRIACYKMGFTDAIKMFIEALM